MKKTLLGAAFAAAFMGFGAAAQAQSIIVNVAPPAPRHEVIPAPRVGQVWARGHYQWRNGQYAWVPGHWVTARAGYVYREPQWVQRANGSWVMVGNSWERRAYGDKDRDGIANRYDRDRDGDGIANRYDPRPTVGFSPNGDMDRDGIRNANDNDRDGDRVANARDRHPNDGRRW
jgi:hypothetical protein